MFYQRVSHPYYPNAELRRLKTWTRSLEKGHCHLRIEVLGSHTSTLICIRHFRLGFKAKHASFPLSGRLANIRSADMD